MRTLCLVNCLTMAVLSGCEKHPTDGVLQSAQLESQIEVPGKLLHTESPRERKGGE